MSGLSMVHAVVLGLVEGVTEFLPISSTGHLIVAERLMKLPGSEALDAYTVIIQIGAIAAVIGLYWQRMVSLLQGLLGRSQEGRRLLLALIVAFLPAGIVGAALSKKIDAHLLNPRTVVVAWIVGGAILLKVAPLLHGSGRPRGPKLEARTARQAGIIGEAQILALIPGTSRSLVTIIAAVLVGLSLAAAVEFSFLLGLMTLTAVTVFKLVKNGGAVFTDYGVAAPMVGIVVAGTSAFIAVRTFVAFLKTRNLAGFGWYRIGIALATIMFLATKTIPN